MAIFEHKSNCQYHHQSYVGEWLNTFQQGVDFWKENVLKDKMTQFFRQTLT